MFNMMKRTGPAKDLCIYGQGASADFTRESVDKLLKLGIIVPDCAPFDYRIAEGFGWQDVDFHS